MHFLSIWLIGITVITNSSGDSASPWNKSLWIFISGFPPSVSSTLQFSIVFSINFMTSSDILYILQRSIIQLCGTISYTFLVYSRRGEIFPFRFAVFWMFWSMYNSCPAPLVPSRHPFCSLGNSPWLISKSLISSLIFAISIFHMISRHVMGLKFFWGVLFGSGWSFFLSSNLVCLFLISIYSSPYAVCHGWKWFF